MALKVRGFFGIESTVNWGLILKMRIYRKFWKSVFKNFRKMKKVRKMYIPERNMFLLKGTF